MQTIQNSAVEDLPELRHPKSKPLQKGSIFDVPKAERLYSNDVFYLDQDDHSYSMYSKEMNLKYNNNNTTPFSSGRGRRAARSNTGSSRTTCTLSIQTDPLLWKHISEQVCRMEKVGCDGLHLRRIM